MACRQCADDVSWCGQHTRMHRWHADDMRMMCRRCMDDVHVTPGVVLHEIRQLRQEQLCIKPKMASLLLVFFTTGDEYNVYSVQGILQNLFTLAMYMTWPIREIVPHMGKFLWTTMCCTEMSCEKQWGNKYKDETLQYYSIQNHIRNIQVI